VVVTRNRYPPWPNIELGSAWIRDITGPFCRLGRFVPANCPPPFGTFHGLTSTKTIRGRDFLGRRVRRAQTEAPDRLDFATSGGRLYGAVRQFKSPPGGSYKGCCEMRDTPEAQVRHPPLRAVRH